MLQEPHQWRPNHGAPYQPLTKRNSGTSIVSIEDNDGNHVVRGHATTINGRHASPAPHHPQTNQYTRSTLCHLLADLTCSSDGLQLGPSSRASASAALEACGCHILKIQSAIVAAAACHLRFLMKHGGSNWRLTDSERR